MRWVLIVIRASHYGAGKEILSNTAIRNENKKSEF